MPKISEYTNGNPPVDADQVVIARAGANRSITWANIKATLFGTPTMTGQATIPTINLTGGQIVFPATQAASAGANTLDDYEEGTWTPNQGAGLTLVGAFSSSGRYTKIGRSVNVNGVVSGATSVEGASGGVICTNLPFTVLAINTCGNATNNNINVSSTTLAIASGTTIYLCTALPATANIFFSATYDV